MPQSQTPMKEPVSCDLKMQLPPPPLFSLMKSSPPTSHSQSLNQADPPPRHSYTYPRVLCQSVATYMPPSYEMTMWLKCPGTFILHFSQSVRYPMLNDFFMPGCHVHESIVCRDRVWPLRAGEGVVGGPGSCAAS